MSSLVEVNQAILDDLEALVFEELDEDERHNGDEEDEDEGIRSGPKELLGR